MRSKRLRKMVLSAAMIVGGSLLFAGFSQPGMAQTNEGAAPLFNSLPANIQKSGKIVVGSAINYPPFEYYASDGTTPIGFEVELSQALEKVLGVKFEWHNASFDTLFASLRAGRYNIVFGATNDTPERENVFDMVDYIQASQAFVVGKGNPHHVSTVLDLCGQPVAAIRGGVQPKWLLSTGSDMCVKAGKDKIKVLTFGDAAGEQLAVREGKAIALLENFATAVAFAQSSDGALELVPHLQVAKTYYAMVVPKSDSKLSDALRKGWDMIIKNGEYGKILAKWHLSDIAIPQSYVNGATSHPPKGN